MKMRVSCFRTKPELCKTIYILKGYIDSNSDLNKNLQIGHYFFFKSVIDRYYYVLTINISGMLYSQFRPKIFKLKFMFSQTT